MWLDPPMIDGTSTYRYLLLRLSASSDAKPGPVLVSLSSSVRSPSDDRLNRETDCDSVLVMNAYLSLFVMTTQQVARWPVMSTGAPFGVSVPDAESRWYEEAEPWNRSGFVGSGGFPVSPAFDTMRFRAFWYSKPKGDGWLDALTFAAPGVPSLPILKVSIAVWPRNVTVTTRPPGEKPSCAGAPPSPAGASDSVESAIGVIRPLRVKRRPLMSPLSELTT